MKPLEITEPDTVRALDALDGESDRGAAVLAGSLVENALGRCLAASCSANIGRSAAKELFSSNGPIASFSQRILIAAGFGLIGPVVRQRLDLVRAVRNHFAHHPLDASFEDAYVVDRTKQLPAVSPLILPTFSRSRVAYVIACAKLLGHLEILTDQVQKQNHGKEDARDSS